MENANERDDILFEQLKKAKRRKRRKVIFTVLTLLILAGAGIFITVRVLRERVRAQFAASTVQVLSAQASSGRINTTVSGSGSLSYTDFEDITVPEGVTVSEILVSAGENVKAGDAVASVDPDTVLSALADIQSTLESLDKQINTAKNDSSSTYVSSSLAGRIKAVYVQTGDNVMDVMAEHGALALISLDGYMTLTVEAQLEPGQVVTVESLEKQYPGTVESCIGGKSVILLTDNGPKYGELAAILDEAGQTLASGTLEIRSPLSITGFAGIVGWVSVQENQQIYSGSSLFTLSNTKYTSNYDTLLRQRSEAEKTMGELVGLMQRGYVEAPIDGIVTAVADSGAESTSYLMQATGTASNGIVTVAPDKQVTVSVAVDETDILSLSVGQSAEVTVSSVGEDVYPGTVTEISKIGTSASGVTQYTAIVTLDKSEKMLSGMTASVDIQIQGVDDVVLIPADALRQTRNTSYVFTSYDEAAKEYGGMVEVTTGASNSRFVEIVSGLKPGDTVYYTEKSSNNFMGFTMPGMANMGGNRGNTGSWGGNNRSGSNGGSRTGG